MRFERLNKEALMKALQDGVSVELESTDFAVPRAALPLLVTMGDALVARAPEDLEPMAAEALGDVHRLCEVGRHAVAHNTIARPRVDMRVLRRAATKQTLVVRGVVEAMTGSADGDDAKRAQHVYDVLFAGMPSLAKMTPRRVLAAGQVMEHQLGADPGLRAELDRMVPSSTTEAALGALRALADAVGAQDGADVQAIDLVPIRHGLRQRAMRYAAAMLATAKPDDVATRRRVQEALQPIVELRAELAPRRGKRTKAPVAEAPKTTLPVTADAPKPGVGVAPVPPEPEGRGTD